MQRVILSLKVQVKCGDECLWSGVIDRNAPPLEWIPNSIQEATLALGLSSGSLETKHTHPNDLKWTPESYSETLVINVTRAE